jgi:hypothetical protein
MTKTWKIGYDIFKVVAMHGDIPYWNDDDDGSLGFSQGNGQLLLQESAKSIPGLCRHPDHTEHIEKRHASMTPQVTKSK